MYQLKQIKWLGLIVAAVFAAEMASSQSAGNGVFTIDVVDLGIGQPPNRTDPSAVVMSGSSGDYTHVHPALNGVKDAEIVVQMPTDGVLDANPNDDQLEDIIMTGLVQQVDQARAAGTNEVEIQFIENMTLGSYPWKQNLADRFGRIAYKAIGQLINQLKSGGTAVQANVTAGSNGTAVFSCSVDSWSSYADDLTDVTLFSGRALIPNVKRALEALGPGKMTIITTKGDVYALLNSIANFDADTILWADDQVGMTFDLYLISPIDGKSFSITLPFPNHLLLADSPNVKVKVKKYGLNGLEPVGTYTGHEIMAGGALRNSDSGQATKRDNGPAAIPTPRPIADETPIKKKPDIFPPFWPPGTPPPLSAEANPSESPEGGGAIAADGDGSPTPPGGAAIPIENQTLAPQPEGRPETPSLPPPIMIPRPPVVVRPVQPPPTRQIPVPTMRASVPPAMSQPFGPIAEPTLPGILGGVSRKMSVSGTSAHPDTSGDLERTRQQALKSSGDDSLAAPINNNTNSNGQ
jgi:hypothetical protein